jgi:hypothetical protein
VRELALGALRPVMTVVPKVGAGGIETESIFDLALRLDAPGTEPRIYILTFALHPPRALVMLREATAADVDLLRLQSLAS